MGTRTLNVARLSGIDRLAGRHSRIRLSRSRLLGVAAMAALLATAACAPETGGGGSRPQGAVPTSLESPLGSYLAGRFAHSERDTSSAAEFYAQALTDDPNNSALAHRTLILMIGDGRFPEASELAKRVLTLDPHDGIANILLADDAVHKGDFASAEKAIAAAGQSGFNSVLNPLIGAWVELGLSKPEDAIKSLKPLQENAAFAPFFHYHSALLNDVMGRNDAASAAYRETLAGAGGASLRVVEAFGNFLQRQGHPEDARKLYSVYLTQNPDSPAIASIMESLQSQDKPAALIGTATEGAAEAFFGAASVLSRQDGGEGSEVYLQLALHIRADFPVARILLADILESNQRYNEALEQYRAVNPKSPFGWSARLRAAGVLEEMNRPDEAIAALRSMSREQPARLEPLITVGDILRAQQKFGEAADAYTQALGSPDVASEQRWSLYYARGIAYERSSQWPKAEADFLAALKLKPEQPLVLNYLGYSWVERGEHLDQAVGMLERAVQIKPNDGFIVDSLGWAQYRLGRYPDAVGNLERAVELKPDDPTINDHLGDAYWRVGRKSEARFQWQRALALKPEPGMIPGIRAKIDTGLGNPPAGGKAAQATGGG
ncbi:MAG TPA: tetratricopeptide repeat protein [Candidatus Cybelea sp.]|nr:tetratricopeptide repeat protein [Candidatus Cybelea sp.]